MSIPSRLSSIIFQRDDWKCRNCNNRQGLHPHHVTYASRGGADAMNNLVTICFECHRAIHDGKLRVEVVSHCVTNLEVKFWRIS